MFWTYLQAFYTKTSQSFSGFITATILAFLSLLSRMNRSVAMGKTGAGPGFSLACFLNVWSECIFGTRDWLCLQSSSWLKPWIDILYRWLWLRDLVGGKVHSRSKCISECLSLKGTQTYVGRRMRSGGGVELFPISNISPNVPWSQAWFQKNYQLQYCGNFHGRIVPRLQVGGFLCDLFIISSLKALSTPRGWGSSD